MASQVPDEGKVEEVYNKLISTVNTPRSRPPYGLHAVWKLPIHDSG